MQETSKTQKTPKEIHEAWQKTGVFTAKNGESKPKYYCLDMFPYPSAQGLHVGHPEGYTATDILSRYKRMHGMNVLHPMGWDAFGLPAENYAIKTGVDPDTSTHANINNFRRQIQDLGFSYDWSREVDTSSPEYYRWTQWMFAQMYKNGLAYKKKARVNWCNTCQTVLANEQVIDGMCERSKDLVVQKELEQWFFKVTAYAERLLADLDTIDWPEPIKLMQRNWIGKSVGIEIDYPVDGMDATVRVFTTRPDTNFGATFVVLAPDSAFIREHIAELPHTAEVLAYVEAAKRKTELERMSEGKKKTGVFTGVYVTNRLNDKKLPVYVSDFVLGSVGTGAVVGVPGHDKRDFEFAQAMGIEVIRVVVGPDMDESAITAVEQVQEDAGVMVNSDFLNGMDIHAATKKIMDVMEEKQWGTRVTNFKIRDWLISRQRYWGAPIPIVYDPQGKPHLVEDKYLPLKLPTDVDFRPKGTSPLGSSASYAVLAEELYGKGWHFEVDTMDTFVCSSWYYLRYCDPNNTKEFAAQELLKQWLPVDMYVGGAEHAVLHLLYARFFHKALQDFGFIPQQVGNEPFKALRNQGMILGEDNQKMSKSRGNVINPDDIVNQYGADTLRMYEMFLGPFDDVKPWSTDSIKGIKKFLDRVSVAMRQAIAAGADKHTHESTGIHGLIQGVERDIEAFRFNTAIAKMMIYMNEADFKSGEAWDMTALKKFVAVLSVFAPFTTEELWYEMGEYGVIASIDWPPFDPALAQKSEVTVAVQVNGKTRGTVVTTKEATQEHVLALAHADEKISKHITGKNIVKEIYVPGRILNLIIKE